MRRFLIPLLAALALPNAVNAESHWLILTFAISGASLEKIEMPSAEACEKEGRKWEKSPTQRQVPRFRSFHCVIGK